MNSKNIYFAYRSFWPELQTIERFGKLGINTVCIFPANTANSLGEPYSRYGPIWVWHDTYDFEPLDRQINDIIGVNADAELLVMVDLNTPLWWTRQFSHIGDSMTQLSFVANHPQWRHDTLNYLQTFLHYTERNYGDRIRAYILAGGSTCEWLDRTRGAEFPDKERAFYEWSVGKNLAWEGRIPCEKKRNQSSHGLLRDPESEGDLINYIQFLNETIAETIKVFVIEARKHIQRRTELGVFYGYIVDYPPNRHATTRGHLAYENLYGTPGLDFIISPGTYGDRRVGGGSGFLSPHRSVRLRGLRWLHEADHRTHTSNMKLSKHVTFDFQHWPDVASTAAGLKREMALCLIEKASVWWFDMWGRSYCDPRIMELFKTMKRLWDEHIGRAADKTDEVLMVVDPRSSYCMNDQDAAFKLFGDTRRCLNRIGAPYSICSFDDLPGIEDLDRYRFILFNTPFVIDQERRCFLENKVLRNDRHILWLYAPGISDGRRYDESCVESLCGVPFGTPGLQERDMGTWRSFYLHHPGDLTPEMLRNIAALAGVHLYCDPATPIYANSRYLAIHSATGGRHEIRLNKTYAQVKDLFRNEIVTEKNRRFSLTLKSPDTLLLELIP